MARQLQKLSAFLVAILLAAGARGDTALDSIGLIGADARHKFSGMEEAGILLGLRIADDSDSFWVPSELVLSVGVLERGADSAEYLSFGPTYRVPFGKASDDRWFIGFGVHPTYVSDSRFEGKDLGGHFFFTSFLGVGTYLDRQRETSVMLRYQHTSNGGLDDRNPGVDMLALTYRYRFGRARNGS